MAEHVPVMLDEVLEALAVKPGEVVCETTLGLAGHAVQLGKRAMPGGLLIGLDWDESMLAIAQERLKSEFGAESESFKTFNSDYRDLPDCLRGACAATGRPYGADAILIDMGLNNAQIEDAERGISYSRPGPADMRMDRSKGEPASAFLNRASAAQIEKVLKEYGDENWARKISQVIVETRKTHPIRTTQDIVDCVMRSIPPSKRETRIHPATRTFQALRIHVNGELDGLEEAVRAIALCLNQGGRMAVLSYHSGEDRACKRAFHALAHEDDFAEPFRKPKLPTEGEIKRNPKSRSAKLRVLVRTRRKEDECSIRP